MECKHKFNKSSIEAAEKSKRPERAKIQCVKCEETVLLEEAVKVSAKKSKPKEETEECQLMETIASELPTES